MKLRKSEWYLYIIITVAIIIAATVDYINFKNKKIEIEPVPDTLFYKGPIKIDPVSPDNFEEDSTYLIIY